MPGHKVPHIVGKPCIRCGSKERYRVYPRNDGWIGKTGACVRCRARISSHGRVSREFGLTLDEYEAMKKRAGKTCPICRARPPTNLDHCHATGKVRGFVCWDCNTALGKMFDNHRVVYRAWKFLKNKGSL